MQTDPVTELPNRRAWDEVLAKTLRTIQSPVCVALIDLDNFKTYNDGHGHQEGDVLLRAAGTAWCSVLRANDILVRFGGDEFALLLPDCDGEHAARIAERLRRSTPSAQGASIGVAQWNRREDAESLMNRADMVLYQAKDEGRDRVASAE